MGSNKKMDDVIFQMQLLLKICDMEKYPFIKIIIQNGLTRQEYNEVIELIESLEDTYNKQSEEGLLDFQSLLIHFVGMLNEKLEPIETLQALKREGRYPSLINRLLDIHSENT